MKYSDHIIFLCPIHIDLKNKGPLQIFHEEKKSNMEMLVNDSLILT